MSKQHLLALLLSLWLGTAWAGQGCNQTPIQASDLAHASRNALRLYERLQASPWQAVLLAREGSDLSPYGLHYSHVGVALRDSPKGPWTVFHLLNECGTAHSSLYDEGLTNFYLDDLQSDDTLILIPDPALQEAMVRQASTPQPAKLHEPNYNMIARPGSPQFQNSNQWVLEWLASLDGDSPALSREAARTRPLYLAFTPDVIEIDRLTRLGAGLFKANVDFHDHPFADRVAGRYQVVSVRSVARALLASRRLAGLLEYRQGRWQALKQQASEQQAAVAGL